MSSRNVEGRPCHTCGNSECDAFLLSRCGSEGRLWKPKASDAQTCAHNPLAEGQMADLSHAAAYYKAAILKEPPPFVPARVRVLREQFGDPPFQGAGVAAGEHDCQCNKWGAVSVIARDGNPLGLRMNEFEPLAWRENVLP